MPRYYWLNEHSWVDLEYQEKARLNVVTLGAYIDMIPFLVQGLRICIEGIWLHFPFSILKLAHMKDRHRFCIQMIHTHCLSTEQYQLSIPIPLIKLFAGHFFLAPES